eukprot:gene4283-4703_t
MTIVLSSSKTYEPLFWLAFYVVALSIHIRGGKLFWVASDIAAMVTLVLIILYLLGSSTVANFSEHATDHNTYSASQFFLYFPLPSWFFVGVEALTLACENIAQPTRNVPRAMVCCVLTLIITALCIVFVSASVAPGAKAIADAYLPFNFGFSQYFGISSHLAAILNLPGMFATAFGFMFAYGRQLFAMSRSKLLPTFLSEVYGQQQTPISSLITGSACGMIVLLTLFFNYDSFTKKLFNLCRDPQSESRVNPWSEATTERSRSSLQDRFRALGPFYTSLRNDAESVISGELPHTNEREPLLRRSFRWEDACISLSETSTIGLYQQPCKIPSVPLLPLDEIRTHDDC